MPPLAQQFIIRLLYTSDPIPVAQLLCIYDDAKNLAQEDLARILKLCICRQEGGRLRLDSIFRSSLHFALVGGGDHTSFGILSTSSDKYDVSVQYLDEYATHAWESVLHFLVGTPSDQQPDSVVHLLQRLGLMQKRYVT